VTSFELRLLDKILQNRTTNQVMCRYIQASPVLGIEDLGLESPPGARC
jgi:hypothetical protein